MTGSRCERVSGLVCCGLLLGITGCHSAFVQATVTNAGSRPVPLFEVDYPSASFGSGNLAPGATFKYRFKILGDGGTKILWTDQAGHDHTVKGPNLHEGQEGTLSIVVQENGASWQPALHEAR